MILSKRELIDQLLSDFQNPDYCKESMRIFKRIVRKIRRMPEEDFIEKISNELNYKVEIIRKNLYIIH